MSKTALTLPARAGLTVPSLFPAVFMNQPQHVALGDSQFPRTLFIAPHRPIQPLTGGVSAGRRLYQFVLRLAFRPHSVGGRRLQVLR